MSGDRDVYHTPDRMTAVYKMIDGSQLSFVPGCDHVVFYCNFPVVWESIVPFLK
jgi:hypothetical protein